MTTNPTAAWIAGQVTKAFPWSEAPRFICSATTIARSGRPTLGAFVRWASAIIQSRRVSPWQNGCVERLIGSTRRECLDQMIIFGEAHLRRVLKAYATYYNQVRTHLSLDKDAPNFRISHSIGSIVAMPMLGGLHHQYVQI